MPRDLLTKIEMRSPHSGPISQALLESGVRTETRIEPNAIRPALWMISEMPSVRISWAKCPSPSTCARVPLTRPISALCTT